jgi:hypothetical protein
MSTIIPNTKYGDCDFCPAKNTSVVKRGKEYLCLNCKRTADNKKQIQKANERSKVRGLLNYQRSEGVVDSVSELKIDMDRVFSMWLRLSAAGKDLKCECFTCGVRKDWKVMQCGHFISRKESALRYELDNNKVQCKYCNVDLRGNLEVYAQNLERDKKGIVEYLNEQAREVTSLSRSDLKELLTLYQFKLTQLEKIKLQ